MHRDISLGNILISQQPGREDGTGLLIDFDYSKPWMSGQAGDDAGVPGGTSASKSHDDTNTKAEEDDEAQRIWTVCQISLVRIMAQHIVYQLGHTSIHGD